MAAKKNDTEMTDQPNERFDPKWLTGLTFATTEQEKVKDDDGKESIKHTPVKRPLEEGDLLDWKVYGNEVVLVTADGRKHRVKR